MKTPAAESLEEFVRETNGNHIDAKQLQPFERMTGHKSHRYLRRGIVFCVVNHEDDWKRAKV